MKRILLFIHIVVFGLIITSHSAHALTCAKSDGTTYDSTNTSCNSGETAVILPSAPNTSCPPGYTGNCGDYTINDFMKIGINAVHWIWGIVGSIALLMFVYGGLMFLISGGSQEKVTQGKQIIVGSVIGLVIVFASYTIIGYIFSALDIPGWNSSGWFK